MTECQPSAPDYWGLSLFEVIRDDDGAEVVGLEALRAHFEGDRFSDDELLESWELSVLLEPTTDWPQPPTTPLELARELMQTYWKTTTAVTDGTTWAEIRSALDADVGSRYVLFSDEDGPAMYLAIADAKLAQVAERARAERAARAEQAEQAEKARIAAGLPPLCVLCGEAAAPPETVPEVVATVAVYTARTALDPPPVCSSCVDRIIDDLTGEVQVWPPADAEHTRPA